MKKNTINILKIPIFFYVYKPKCQISYHSDNGKLTADFTGKKISFEPGTFNSAELRSITKLVYQKSRTKIFSTYSLSDVNKRYLNSNNIAIIIGRSLIWKFFVHQYITIHTTAKELLLILEFQVNQGMEQFMEKV